MLLLARPAGPDHRGALRSAGASRRFVLCLGAGAGAELPWQGGSSGLCLGGFVGPVSGHRRPYAPRMEKILDELDNQEMHLRRLARRIDALQPTGSDVELQISRTLHLSFESIYTSWTDVREAPPGWPGATAMLMERLRAQLEAIEMVARRRGDGRESRNC